MCRAITSEWTSRFVQRLLKLSYLPQTVHGATHGNEDECMNRMESQAAEPSSGAKQLIYQRKQYYTHSLLNVVSQNWGQHVVAISYERNEGASTYITHRS